MALHTNLPIYKVAYDLLDIITDLAKNMPRDFKASIGGKLRDECVEIVVLIFRSNVALDKAAHLTSLVERQQVCELLLRLSRDKRLISTGQYAKAIELGVPVTINVGIPGPRVPGECQNPMHLDEVMYFFPELVVVMAHGGEPWETTCVKLMLKWPNLYYYTSAFVPKHYPKAIIDFANTRGADKVFYAGYHPTIALERLQQEMQNVPLRPHVWPKFLRENAIRVFKLDQV